MKRASGFTMTELMVVMVVLALLIAVLIPGLERARESVRRTACGANLSSLYKVLTNYAERETWPDAGKSSDGKINTTASLWLLVKDDPGIRESFVCPSDAARGRVGVDRSSVDPAKPFPRLPNGRASISYSYQVPHDWNPGMDHNKAAGLAVMADRSPFDPPPSPAPGKTIDQANASKWSAVPAGQKDTGDKIDAFITGKLNDTERMRVNSPNHGGDGQNVLYRSGNVEWRRTPLAGIDYDNIYTRRSSSTTVTGRSIGTGPDSNNTQTPFDRDDSYLRTFPAP